MFRISEKPFTERPRERCLRQGPGTLSMRECIALLLGTGPRGKGCLGLAHEVTERAGAGLPEAEEEHAFFAAMESHALLSLQDIPGLGDAGRARILAALEIGKRYASYRETMRRRVSVPKQKHALPEKACDRVPALLRSKAQEWLGFVPVHRSGELGEFCVVELGVRTHVNIDPAELFCRVLALRPVAFFLFHNHPSGDLTPSAQDIELTREVNSVASSLGIRLLGHGIVTSREERWIVI